VGFFKNKKNPQTIKYGGWFFYRKLYYLTSSALGASAFAESTETTVESTLVESATTAVESVFTSVDVPVPQDANATIDKIARIFFIFFLFLG
jgi:hypothetical protein